MGKKTGMGKLGSLLGEKGGFVEKKKPRHRKGKGLFDSSLLGGLAALGGKSKKRGKK